MGSSCGIEDFVETRAQVSLVGSALRRSCIPGSILFLKQIPSSCEIGDFVGTLICKLCVILRSSVPLCVRILLQDTGRQFPLELQQCSLYQRVNSVMLVSLCAEAIKTVF